MKLSFKVVVSLVVINSSTESYCNAQDNITEEVVATDVGASKNSDPSDMDIRADGPWLQRGEFVLERRQLVIPDDGPQVFYNCIGGYDSNYARLVVGNPGIDIENNIDTSTWTDNPVTEMNTTLNKDIQQIAELELSTILNGIGCVCGIHQLDFGEWLRVNNDHNSTFGVDIFSVPAFFMPSNWRDGNATYGPVPEGSNNTAYIDLVETPSNNTPPVAVINSFGLKKPELALSSTPGGTAVFTSTNDLVTNNKFIKIHSDGEGPVTIRAMSEGRYNLVLYLIQEDPPYLFVNEEFDPLGIMGQFPSSRPFNQVDMYTDRSASTFSETNAYILPPPTDGYYYQIMIKNDEDGSFSDFDSTDNLKCTIGKYGLELKNEVSLSLESCEVTACNGGIVKVNADPTDPSEASKNIGQVLLIIMPFLLGCLLSK